MKLSYSNKESVDIKNNEVIILRLIYFWAFVEAGLGGMMHLFHIPLTGFVVGGFSIIINVLLAKYSNNSSAVFLKALGIVLAIKILLSPYTPLGAYIAVSFQGLLAVLLFTNFGLKRLIVYTFSIIVMIQSALQKPLLAYIIFGKRFFDSIIKLLSETFSISKDGINNVLVIAFIIYISLYVLWGIIIANWANNVRTNIETINLDRNKIESIKEQVIFKEKTVNEKHFPFITVAVILIITLLIPAITASFTASYYIRTTILLLFLLLVIPLLIKKHLSLLSRKNYKNSIVYNTILPTIRINTAIAWKLCEPFGGLKKVKYFVMYAIWLNVFYE